MATEKKISSVESIQARVISLDDINMHKGVTIFTYLIALICLLAGLLVPLYGSASALTDRMLLLYLPDALNVALGKAVFTGTWVKSFADLYAPLFFGHAVSILAWTVVVYAAVTLIGIIFLIPVIAGSRIKVTSAVFAYTIEVAAALTLGVYIFFALINNLHWYNYAIWIAFGGDLFMLIVQTLFHKKALGFYKFIVILLTAISIVALFDVVVWLSFLKTPIDNLTSTLKADALFVGGYYGIDYFVNGLLNLQNIKTIFTELKLGVVISATITVAFVIVNALIDIIGLSSGTRYTYIEEQVEGLENEYIHRYYKFYSRNTGSKIFGFIRYALEFCSAVVTIILLITFKTPIGIYLYVITAVAFILTFIAIIRLCLLKSKKMQEILIYNEHWENKNTAWDLTSFDSESLDSDDEEDEEERKESTTIVNTYNTYYTTTEPAKEEKEETTTNSFEEEVEEEPKPAEPVYEYPIPQSNDYPEPEPFEYPEPEETKPQPAEPVVDEKANAYADRPYTGPTDKFLNTLTDAEKAEFAEIFLNKTKGNLPKIPDYVVGEENEDFFPAVFIYLGKIRNMVSSDLMNKLYKHINLMH